MTIQYLTKMQQYPELRNWTNKGMSMENIEILESKYNNGSPFPKAYREFLFLGGEHCNLGDIDQGLGYEWMQQTAKKALAEYGQSIGRPFWVTDQLDRCEQFGFIYMDEQKDDPDFYWCMPAYVGDGDPLIQLFPERSFSKVIDEYIDRAIITDNRMKKR